MKKSGLLTLVIFLVLLLSCPLLAQEKTNDPRYRVQLASGVLNYQCYGPYDSGSEAEGYWAAKQRASESFKYQRYGPDDCGSEAEGYWAADSENHHWGQYETTRV